MVLLRTLNLQVPYYIRPLEKKSSIFWKKTEKFFGGSMDCPKYDIIRERKTKERKTRRLPGSSRLRAALAPPCWWRQRGQCPALYSNPTKTISICWRMSGWTKIWRQRRVKRSGRFCDWMKGTAPSAFGLQGCAELVWRAPNTRSSSPQRSKPNPDSDKERPDR